MTSIAGRSLAMAAAVTLAATPALAEKAAQLTFLNGQDAGSAEQQLRNRGFTHVSSHDSYANGFVTSYW